MSFSVRTDVCVRCNMCVAECPTGLLVMKEHGPEAGRGSCISCGHCVAVCPTKAIDYSVTPREEQLPVGDYRVPAPEEAEQFYDIVVPFVHLAISQFLKSCLRSY